MEGLSVLRPAQFPRRRADNFGVATRLHIEVAEPVVMALRQVDWRSNSVIYAAW
jgi:hypothetical protein